jgi:thiol-disulfide isomerase/thioredoxin
MQKSYLLRLCALLLLVTVSAIDAVSQSNDLSKPVPTSARQTFKLANELAEQEKFATSAVALKKTIAVAPQFLQAHIKYINLRTYFMGEQTEVKAEYENLMKKNPANPVYSAALAVALFTESQQTRRGWFETVTKLAPDWVWSHYARAQMLQDKEPEAAVAEYLKMIEKEPLEPQPYADAIFIQRLRLKKTDDAIATAEKMLKHPELRITGQSNLWRFHLAKAGTTEEAKAKLRQELSQLGALSKDVASLAAIYAAYNDLLTDKEAAKAIEEKIIRIDPTWYPERGLRLATVELTDKGPYHVVYAGRQLAIYNKLRMIDYDLPAEEQIARLEQLLLLNLNGQMKRKLYTRFFGAAERAADDASIVKFGEVLLTFDAKDASTLSIIAQALANQKKGLVKALDYIRRADELTKEFHAVKNIQGISGNKFFEDYYSEKEQAERYQMNRAQILESYGWVLFQSGKNAEAESKLRESIELDRNERKLSRLSKVLRALNRIEESDSVAEEAKNEYTESLKRRFTNLPSKDFELSTIEGRKVKLSDLKGKVVMVNFWATWCQPCIKEMPLFVRTYEKYKDRGFEILAISVDDLEDRPKIASLASRFSINFPILYDEGIAKLYEAKSFPTTVFIGKDGNIRYQNFGLIMETAERDLGIIIEELLKDKQGV